MSPTPEVRERISEIVAADRVVLFMKGNPDQPQCGFSARVVEVLGRLLPEYSSFDVLADPEIREGIKAFSDWPTIPQLYIDGEFQGGCDIVMEMYGNGELHQVLGLERPSGSEPAITIDDAAAQMLREAQSQQGGAPLHLGIDARFRPSLGFGPPAGGEVALEIAGITMLLDPDSASRADGVSFDTVATPQGERLNIDIPGAPPAE